MPYEGRTVSFRIVSYLFWQEQRFAECCTRNPVLDDGTHQYRAPGVIDMSDQDAFEHIPATMHDAMLDDARWPAVSALIDEARGIKCNDLMVGQGPKDDRRSSSSGCTDEGSVAKKWSASTSRATTPSTNACRAFGNSPAVFWCPPRTLFTAEELKTSPTYNEALPRGVASTA